MNNAVMVKFVIYKRTILMYVPNNLDRAKFYFYVVICSELSTVVCIRDFKVA